MTLDVYVHREPDSANRKWGWKTTVNGIQFGSVCYNYNDNARKAIAKDIKDYLDLTGKPMPELVFKTI